MKRYLLTLLAACALASVPFGSADARAKREKTPKASGRAADGSGLFKSNCAYCHGSSGRGDGSNAEKLKPRPADLTALRSSEAQIAGVVRNGKGSCPSWKASLSDAEIESVASYARSLQR